MCGQQASGATFPCYYCTYRHGNKCEKEFKKANFNPVVFTRTFRGQEALAQGYQDPNNKKGPMFFYSTTKRFLLQGRMDEPILRRIAPGQLHLYMGVVNRVIEVMDKKGYNDQKCVYQILRSLKIKTSDEKIYNYEGPKCKAIF